MKFWPLAVLLLCSGCAQLSKFLPESGVGNPVVEEVAVSGSNAIDALWPERSVSELLLDRMSLCQRPEAGVATAAPKPKAESIEVQLDAMLLASCQPDASPGQLNRLLADLGRAGTWPREYVALFDLLLSSQKAYGVVEKMYRDLRDEHEETIRGLGEIEADIELQSK